MSKLQYLHTVDLIGHLDTHYSKCKMPLNVDVASNLSGEKKEKTFL